MTNAEFIAETIASNQKIHYKEIDFLTIVMILLPIIERIIEKKCFSQYNYSDIKSLSLITKLQLKWLIRSTTLKPSERNNAYNILMSFCKDVSYADYQTIVSKIQK